MRGLLARVAVVLLALAPVTASGDSPATVLQAIPGTDGNAIARFTLRFSEAMAPLGGGDAPITMECAVDGAGRWVDPTTYVWEYSEGGQSAILAGQANVGGVAWPGYVERGLDAWRGYFGWLPKGQTITEYVVRVNGAGRFLLPPTRVEAMYSPEIHAALPNQPLVVAP